MVGYCTYVLQTKAILLLLEAIFGQLNIDIQTLRLCFSRGVSVEGLLSFVFQSALTQHGCLSGKAIPWTRAMDAAAGAYPAVATIL